MDAAGFPVSVATDTRIPVLVAQLDKASDYESEDWGFKSLQGYLNLFVDLVLLFCPAPFHPPEEGRLRRERFGFAWMPERSKGADLRSAGRNVRVGSNPTSGTPGMRLHYFGPVGSALTKSVAPDTSLHGLMDKAHPS